MRAVMRSWSVRMAVFSVVTCLGIAAWADASDTVGGSSLGSLYCKLTGGTACAMSSPTSATGISQTWTASDSTAGALGGVTNNSVATGWNMHVGSESNYTALPSIYLDGLVTASGDTGTAPAVAIVGARSSGYTSLTASAVLATKPVLGIYNYTTEVAEVSATGAWSNPSSNVCGSTTAGAFCLSDSAGVTIANASIGAVLNFQGNSALTMVIDTVNAGFNTFKAYFGWIFSFQQQTDVAAGTTVFQVGDTGSATLAAVDGAGNLLLNASATRSKGLKRLAAGTGTVTVNSGAICTCTDTTAAAAVKCSVTTTTLTITGTGTDDIAYHCF